MSRLIKARRNADATSHGRGDPWFSSLELRKRFIDASKAILLCVAGCYVCLQTLSLAAAFEVPHPQRESTSPNISRPTLTAAVLAQPANLPIVSSSAPMVTPTDQDTQAAGQSTSPPVSHPAITVTPGALTSAVNPDLLAAYQAYKEGRVDAAHALYQRVLHDDKRNIDALLGMAAIAWRQKREPVALAWYEAVIAEDPQNPVAQAAMIALQGGLAIASSESRIKSLLRQQPRAAYLHALLGNLYAVRGQWAEAQQAYSAAHQLDSGNARHAFNLAVSLDHLGKLSMALDYYRRAQALLPEYHGGEIDVAQLNARVIQLQQ